MILSGAEGPANGGSYFKMAFAVRAVASARPQESSAVEEEVGRPSGRTDGEGEGGGDTNEGLLP